MKITIHCGLHKTGTTSIQYFCNLYRDTLADAGLVYPLYVDNAGHKHQSHIKLFDGLARSFRQLGNFRNLPDSSLDCPIAFVRNCVLMVEQKDAQLLFSAENISSFSFEKLKAIVQFFLALYPNVSVELLFFIRRPSDLLESLYRNTFRAMVARPLDFISWLDQSLDYVRLDNRFRDHKILESKFKNLSVNYLSYPDPEFDSVAKLLRHIDISLFSHVPLVSMPIKNQSFDVIDCLAKSQLSQFTSNRELFSHFNGFIRNNPVRTSYSFTKTYVAREKLEEIDISWEEFCLNAGLPSICLPGKISQSGCIDSHALRLSHLRFAEYFGQCSGSILS